MSPEVHINKYRNPSSGMSRRHLLNMLIVKKAEGCMERQYFLYCTYYSETRYIRPQFIRQKIRSLEISYLSQFNVLNSVYPASDYPVNSVYPNSNRGYYV